jgi:hypothetical protein
MSINRRSFVKSSAALAVMAILPSRKAAASEGTQAIAPPAFILLPLGTI